jgi:hypothetical protein
MPLGASPLSQGLLPIRRHEAIDVLELVVHVLNFAGRDAGGQATTEDESVTRECQASRRQVSDR